MMLVPRKSPPPLLKTRRATGEPYYEYQPGVRASPERWQPNNWIVRADQNSRRRYSVWWLIWIFLSWAALAGFLVYVFV